ncbi:MAG: flagellar biosynthesis protein FlhB [bacterium]
MAEDSFQEKTEQATPKQLEKAREEGNVAKSAELNSVFVLFIGLMILYFLSGKILSQSVDLFKFFYSQAGHVAINQSSILYYFTLCLKFLVSLVTPLVIGLIVVGLGVNWAQFGFLFSTKPLTPNFQKINPISGLKNFVSLKSLVELLKGIIKITVVGLIAYRTISNQQERYLLLMNESVGNILKFIGSTVFKVAMNTTAALLFLAVLDFLYQRWQYKKDLMMSKQDVKEEQKESEGNPLIKSAIRSLQRARARQRMMDAVPQADVVVTNPTRLAIALKYDPEAMDAPVVLAKGSRLIAARIKEIAQKHGIPIYENKPLAQSLFKISKVGQQIPFELFHVVAEVFAYVYQLKQNKN